MSTSEQSKQFPDFSRLFLWNMAQQSGTHPGFHMPGHAGARYFSNAYADRLIRIDTTELTSSDDLHRPAGPALSAMRESSRLYGSGETLFVTTGSTIGIHVMLASVITPDTFLLLPRTVHMSVVHVLSLLGCRYAFIPFPEEQDRGGYLFPQLTNEVLMHALRLYPQATDILLVSPDYYGQCADLSVLARTAHDNGCRILVDEAHGSHFAFARNICPEDAMTSGADMCVQSLHKTLPALTMASQLHISKEAIRLGRISVPRVWEMLRLFETSSPSFLIAASSEYAFAWMEDFGRQAIEKRMDEIRSFVKRIGPVLCDQKIMCSELPRRDPLRLVLESDPGSFYMPDLTKTLEQKGIFIEFADLKRMVLIISPWQEQSDFDALFEAVRESRGLIGSRNRKQQDMIFETDNLLGRVTTAIPEKALPLRTAVFGGEATAKADIKDAEGKICASMIVPYPPGIPLLWPGERISREHVAVLKGLQDLEFAVHGLDNGKIDIFHG